ncbi:MAG: hypothetical protein ACXAEX_08810 [Promethearchaeota archaeon]|jgi:hypothetical protein
MAHILVTGWTPQHQGDEMLKVTTSKDKPPYPDFIKKTNNWMVISQDGMIKTYAVYECPDDKILDGMKALGRRYTYYTQVEGYKYYPEVLFDAQEIINMFL